MTQIDLHLHTTFSDGTLTPEAVVATAAARGITLIAITDHDAVGGIAPAQAAGAPLGVEVISGVEINTEIGREDVHILGYGFAATSAALLAGLDELRALRLERARRMVQRLADLGYPLEMERVLAIAGHGSVGRPHIACALVEAGYLPNSAAAFDKLIGNRGRAYVPRQTCRPEEAIALIHRAGGVASLAHPAKLGDPIRIIRLLTAAGLDALEAYHSDHMLPGVTDRMLRYARQFNLGVTGGTDSHGPGGTRNIEIGSVPVPDEIGPHLRALITHHRARGTVERSTGPNEEKP